ncbi:MAG: hypothetical protein CMK83_09675 [Pseudomonadales bacterium]|nr:hypothetical protein [Pseudomonadales bacterium]MBI25383.1 hypothetical protein [Pseudomonadales bacterium]RLT89523.1 MAG: hypothetical protein D9N13_12485 [Ketobacter sp. GenoA1]RLT94923.1 MAG: hypothetical protein D9N15_16330 [Ketobacter sp.]TNC88049.1 MAG: hypothetical protein CSH49_13110 [Alcanivorax sp.]|tara:strand:- start:1092 stop:1280 length:189 start_codon:yes stop_codon:yes gene_type:complete
MSTGIRAMPVADTVLNHNLIEVSGSKTAELRGIYRPLSISGRHLKKAQSMPINQPRVGVLDD